MTEDTCTEDTTYGLAKREFKVIRDLLLVPLKPDSPNEELLSHRKWKGGCIRAGLPDLVPVIPAGVENFCKLNNQNQLVVAIKNQGDADAPISTTRVIFFPTGDDKPVVTPAIHAGETIELPIPHTPRECFGRENSCQFVIIVNADFTVVESNLKNNVAKGGCGTGFN